MKVGGDRAVVVRAAAGHDRAAVAGIVAEGFEGAAGAADWSGALNDRQGVALVAVPANGVPVGFVIAGCVLDEAEIKVIAVAPNARRLGVAGRLLDELDLVLRGRGVRRLLLEVSADNCGALALYEGRGFRDVAVRRGYYRSANGDDRDARVMALELVV